MLISDFFIILKYTSVFFPKKLYFSERYLIIFINYKKRKFLLILAKSKVVMDN